VIVDSALVRLGTIPEHSNHIGVVDHKHVSPILEDYISTSFLHKSLICIRATGKHAKHAAFFTEATCELIDFRIADISRVVFAFEEDIRTMNPVTIMQLFKEAVIRAIVENNIHTLATLVELLFSDGLSKSTRENRCQGPHYQRVIRCGTLVPRQHCIKFVYQFKTAAATRFFVS